MFCILAYRQPRRVRPGNDSPCLGTRNSGLRGQYPTGLPLHCWGTQGQSKELELAALAILSAIANRQVPRQLCRSFRVCWASARALVEAGGSPLPQHHAPRQSHSPALGELGVSGPRSHLVGRGLMGVTSPVQKGCPGIRPQTYSQLALLDPPSLQELCCRLANVSVF